MRHHAKMYTVFVDGVEVNDFYLSLEDAQKWHADYTQDGYEPYVHEVVLQDDGEYHEHDVKEFVYVPMKGDKTYGKKE